jgi:molybdopterin-guanine dinucleotide biosynthesis adapter protein
MALVNPFIFQIVGYQNSGKTTFLNKLISRLTTNGIKTATIKHHGHGGKPAIAVNKDSSSHIIAGAAASLVEGGGRLLLQIEDLDWTLEQKIKLISMMNPDLVLIEGHKYENYPKAVFIQNHEDSKLLNQLNRIELVLYQESVPVTDMVSFHRDDSKAIEWLVDYIGRHINTQ